MDELIDKIIKLINEPNIKKNYIDLLINLKKRNKIEESLIIEKIIQKKFDVDNLHINSK